MVKNAPRAAVLVLCSDTALRDSLAELFVSAGRSVLSETETQGSGSPAVVVAACDSWPPGWGVARLRAAFRRVPCLMLSGSPLAGDFAVTGLPRGYFVPLPALPDEILDLVAELSAA